MTEDDFELVFNEELEKKHKVTAEDLWEEYIVKVQPYLSLLAEFKLQTKVLQDEYAYSLKTTPKLFRLMKQYIPELNEVLGISKSMMEFEANLRLIKGANLSPENGKILEMLMKKWDSEYGKKDVGQRIEDVNVFFHRVKADEED